MLESHVYSTNASLNTIIVTIITIVLYSKKSLKLIVAL